MTTITRTWGRGPASSDQRRQMILLAVLGVVLVLLLVWQVPKLVGSGSSSGTTATTASEVAPAAIGASAPTGVQTGSAVASSSPAAARTERWIKRHPARDPFVPLAGNEPAALTTTPAATPPPILTEKPAAPATTTPVKVIPAPEIVPTAAVVVTNGHRQVIGLHQEFTLGGTTFLLVSVDRERITIAVADASFAGGAKQITLDRKKQVSLENAATGVRYSVVFRSATSETPTTTATAAPSASAVGTTTTSEGSVAP